jgi:hypothetical protein
LYCGTGTDAITSEVCHFEVLCTNSPHKTRIFIKALFSENVSQYAATQNLFAYLDYGLMILTDGLLELGYVGFCMETDKNIQAHVLFTDRYLFVDNNYGESANL